MILEEARGLRQSTHFGSRARSRKCRAAWERAFNEMGDTIATQSKMPSRISYGRASMPTLRYRWWSGRKTQSLPPSRAGACAMLHCGNADQLRAVCFSPITDDVKRTLLIDRDDGDRNDSSEDREIAASSSDIQIHSPSGPGILAKVIRVSSRIQQLSLC